MKFSALLIALVAAAMSASAHHPMHGQGLKSGSTSGTSAGLSLGNGMGGKSQSTKAATNTKASAIKSTSVAIATASSSMKVVNTAAATAKSSIVTGINAVNGGGNGAAATNVRGAGGRTDQNRNGGFRGGRGRGRSSTASAVASTATGTTATTTAVNNNPNNSNNNNDGGTNNAAGNNGGGNQAAFTATATEDRQDNGITEGLQTATVVDDATAATSSAAAADPTGQPQGNIRNAAQLQSSLQLDTSQVMTNIQLDGNQVPAEGQSAALTSTNNFINFCATQPNLPLTNGEQVKTGSCNPVPMGVIVAQSVMPSCKFKFPANLDVIPANQDFTVQLAIKNFQAGVFTNAKANYFGAPAFTNNQGQIIGHAHVVIEAIDSLTTTEVSDPTKFAFFKGINTPAVNGILSADVTGGLPAGTYKLSTINSAATHQPILVAVAQHGSLDDVIYFTVADNPGGNNNNNGNANNSAAAGGNNNQATNGQGQQNNNNGQGQRGNGRGGRSRRSLHRERGHETGNLRIRDEERLRVL